MDSEINFIKHALSKLLTVCFIQKKKENRINIPIRFGSTLNHEKMEQNKNIIFLKIHSTFFYNVHVLIKKGVKYSSVLD